MPQKSEGLRGFGFNPAEAQHHFLVTLRPVNKDGQVYISEHLEWEGSDVQRELKLALGLDDNKMRVVLPRAKWDAIADAVRAEFNQRLKARGLKGGRWTQGQVPVARSLGKELILLCWAIEEADPALIPRAIRNWRGLAPEERWWLFTMTNAATGHALVHRGIGWRRAVRYALTENPVTEGMPDLEMNGRAREESFGLFSTRGSSELGWSVEPLSVGPHA
jgi:hypothetical protein